MTSEQNANLRADQSLLAAIGLGACVSVLHIFAWADGTIPWVPRFSLGLADPWLWIATPIVLLLGAYLVVAAGERKEGRRHHRGAMAVLVALAVGMAIFFNSFPFNPVYGVALLLLAVRTRSVLTAAVGVFALAVAIGIFSLQSAGAALGLIMLAVSSFIAATKIGHDRQTQLENEHIIPA
ncbi:hypothetical protein [Arthrobacter sp. CAN_A1]|uniref:hypothetical protein n=1 Tax=Arthrobacter sp. CAN_A1 TaxID=2787717 RepID=UPI0018C9B0E7